MNKVILIFIALLLSSCSQVDDYLLGKDNTPQPTRLDHIENKVKMSKNWSSSVGKSFKTNGYLKLKPVIRQGVVYTANAAGFVQAVQQKDGSMQWSTALKKPIISGPAVNNGYIAIATNDSTLVLLSQDKGKILWESKISGEVLSSPAIAKNKVIAKTIEGRVLAFEASSGKEIWSYEHGSPNLILRASSSPIILDNLVLIGFSDGRLEALDLDTGRQVWERSIAYASGASDVDRLVDIDSDPIVENHIAYLASYQGYIGALSLNDGQFLWKKPASVYKNMILGQNALFITDAHDVLWSLDKSTGQVNWKQTAFKARGLTEPVLAGSKLVVGDKTGYLHVMSAKTGTLLARSQLSGGVVVSPSVAGKHIYVLTDNGMLNQLTLG